MTWGGASCILTRPFAADPLAKASAQGIRMGAQISLRQVAQASGRRARLIRDPIIILGVARSGSSALLAALSAHPELWSLHRESTHILEGPYHPALRGWKDHVLTEEDLDPASIPDLEARFFAEMGNLERIGVGRFVPVRGRGKRIVARSIAAVSGPLRRPPIRIVEKTVQNSLRTGFLKKLFPDARFLHLTRDPTSNLQSLYRGWRNPERHNDYPLPAGYQIVGHDGADWAFVLPSGWRSYEGRTLMEICAFQWRSVHEHALAAAERFEPGDVRTVRFEDLVRDPAARLREIADWAGLDPRPFRRFARGLPRINVTRSRHAEAVVPRDELEAAVAELRPLSTRLGYG